MATIEERVTKVEDAVVKIVAYEGQVIDLLVKVTEHLVKVADQVEEYRRDTKQMQRLWVHLARKYGWLDDEDLLAEG